MMERELALDIAEKLSAKIESLEKKIDQLIQAQQPAETQPLEITLDSQVGPNPAVKATIRP